MTQEQDTAKKIVQILEHGTAELDSATAGKLAATRTRAVLAMRQPSRTMQAEHAYAGAGHSIIEYLRGHHLSWAPMLIALLAAVLIFSLLQPNSSNGTIEVDTLLLASDLPPSAYVDQGFDTWLKKSSRH